MKTRELESSEYGLCKEEQENKTNTQDWYNWSSLKKNN